MTVPESAWPEGTPDSTGTVPVLSRTAHDRAHLSRGLPDPAAGRPVRVLIIDPDRSAPVREDDDGPHLLWDERPEFPPDAVFLGEADGVPYAAVRGERSLRVGGRPVDSWSATRPATPTTTAVSSEAAR